MKMTWTSIGDKAITSEPLRLACVPHNHKTGTVLFQDKHPPWIQFDFHESRVIQEVVIVNRPSCCQFRLFPFQILIGFEGKEWRACQDKTFDVNDPEIIHFTSNRALFPSVKNMEALNHPIKISCGPSFAGNVLKIVGFNKEPILNLCEIEIHGIEL